MGSDPVAIGLWHPHLVFEIFENLGTILGIKKFFVLKMAPKN
jgi:hypothetical protein